MREPSGSFRYRVFGWTLLSELECPELAPGGADPDLFVRFGQAPDSIPGSSYESLVGEAIPGLCLLKFRAAGKFLIRGGKDVTIDPVVGVSPDVLRLFLLGPVLGILAHQRSLFPLHASAILKNGRAIAFAGDSGAGKSTLAAAFLQRGYTVIADDICAVDPLSIPEVLPAAPYLALWEDSRARLGLFTSSSWKVRADLQKFLIPVQHPTGPRFPLHSCYVLDSVPSGTIVLSTLQGMRKVEALAQHTYRRTVLEPLKLVVSNFGHICNVAACARVVVVTQPRGQFTAGALADAIEADLGL